MVFPLKIRTHETQIYKNTTNIIIYIGTGTNAEEDKFIGTKPNKTEKVYMSKDARMQQEHNQKCAKQMIYSKKKYPMFVGGYQFVR